jgi:catalase
MPLETSIPAAVATVALAMGGLASAAAQTSATPTGPADLVAALKNTFGNHAGFRASHAKGFCAAGDFEPSASARALTDSPLYRESRIPATIRFSIGGGNPKAPDKSRSVRGLAIRLQGQSERHELVMISEPVFFAASLESFVEFLKARVPDPATGKPDPARIKAYEARYPDGARQPALLASHPAPSSYAATDYHATHAFGFKAGATTTWARIVAASAQGRSYLSPQEEAALPELFLEDEARARLAKGPIEFVLYAQPAAPGDSLVDPSLPWSASGPVRVELGRLRIRAWAEPSSCDPTTFIPTVLPAGIVPSDDPILRARAAAYGVALGQRLQR